MVMIASLQPRIGCSKLLVLLVQASSVVHSAFGSGGKLVKQMTIAYMAAAVISAFLFSSDPHEALVLVLGQNP